MHLVLLLCFLWQSSHFITSSVSRYSNGALQIKHSSFIQIASPNHYLSLCYILLYHIVLKKERTSLKPPAECPINNVPSGTIHAVGNLWRKQFMPERAIYWVDSKKYPPIFRRTEFFISGINP